MSAPSHYMSRIEEIVGGRFVDGQLEVAIRGTESNAKEMLDRVRRIRRDLKILRCEVRLECADIKTCFPPTLTQTLRHQRHLMLAPYELIINVVDQALVQLDKGQASVEDVLSNKSCQPLPLPRTSHD
jgi:hypothetical protein